MLLILCCHPFRFFNGSTYSGCGHWHCIYYNVYCLVWLGPLHFTIIAILCLSWFSLTCFLLTCGIYVALYLLQYNLFVALYYFYLVKLYLFFQTALLFVTLHVCWCKAQVPHFWRSLICHHLAYYGSSVSTLGMYLYADMSCFYVLGVSFCYSACLNWILYYLSLYLT